MYYDLLKILGRWGLGLTSKQPTNQVASGHNILGECANTHSTEQWQCATCTWPCLVSDEQKLTAQLAEEQHSSQYAEVGCHMFQVCAHHL